MKPSVIIVGMFVLVIVVVVFLRQPKPHAELDLPASAPIAHLDQPNPAQRMNALGDILTDAQDPVFVNQVFPKFSEFLATLDRLGVNPFDGILQPASCSKIQITRIPNGIMCRFVIGDGWSARYSQNQFFSGITYFCQRGPNNPIRAISHADADALSRLSDGAITMPEAEVWRIAKNVADAFRIDQSKFEKPEMYEEGLFEHRLGIYTIEYRKKGSNPINGLNYTRGFSLKATSPTTAVLVSYSHLEATLR